MFKIDVHTIQYSTASIRLYGIQDAHCVQNFKNLCFLQKSLFFQRYDMVLSEANLGDGSFSVCRKCTLKETGQEFAVKIISRRVDCSKEIELLSRCQGHPNVVTLVEVLQVKIIFTNHWAEIHQALSQLQGSGVAQWSAPALPML